MTKLKPLNSEEAWPDPALEAEYYDILTTEECFDVEDPDPANRTWYYDGWGIRRKKPDEN